MPRTVPGRPDDADWCVPSALVHRLLRASAEEGPAIVAHLPDRQRARVAYFCYARKHLHAVGLAIAATCDLQSLMAAAPSNGAGSGLYAQSREQVKPMLPSLTGRRPITLAKSVTGHHGLERIIALAANDEQELDCATYTG
jgi:hypothetical protein